MFVAYKRCDEYEGTTFQNKLGFAMKSEKKNISFHEMQGSKGRKIHMIRGIFILAEFQTWKKKPFYNAIPSTSIPISTKSLNIFAMHARKALYGDCIFHPHQVTIIALERYCISTEKGGNIC